MFCSWVRDLDAVDVEADDAAELLLVAVEVLGFEAVVVVEVVDWRWALA